MAILGYLESTLKIARDVAKEYTGTDSYNELDPKVVTKYVEAISDANFAVQCRIIPGYTFTSDFLSAEICMDGKIMDTMVFPKKEYSTRTGCSVTFDGAYVDSEHGLEIRKFRFGELRISKYI